MTSLVNDAGLRWAEMASTVMVVLVDGGGGLGGQHKDILLSTTFLADPISSAYLCHAWRRRSLAMMAMSMMMEVTVFMMVMMTTTMMMMKLRRSVIDDDLWEGGAVAGSWAPSL